MHLILLIFTLFVPRLVILILWFFSGWFTGIFATWFIPLLGFLFTPYTLLWYTIVQRWFNGEWGIWQMIFMGVALLLDLSQLNKKK